MGRTVGDAFVEGLINDMATSYEMDAEEIALELVACGYDEDEAERLAARPWAVGS